MDLLAAAAERGAHATATCSTWSPASRRRPRPCRSARRPSGRSTSRCSATPSRSGIPELREAIAGHHRRMHGLDVDPDDVVVTTGSSGGFLLAFLAAFEAGDRVAIARPGYACYRNVLTALGCEVVELPAGPESRFQPTVAMLEALDGPVQGLVVASPANPTGTMLAPARARRPGDLVRGARRAADQRRDLPRHRVRHPDAALLGLGDLARGGGVQLVLEVLLDDRLADRLDARARAAAPARSTCSPATSRSARRCWPSTPPSRRSPRRRTPSATGTSRGTPRTARLLLDGLPRLGIDRLAPADGAFYVYADVGHLTDDSMAFCHRLLAETGVATAPGRRLRHRGRQPVRAAVVRGHDRRRGRGAGAAGALALEPLPVSAASSDGLAPLVRTDRDGLVARTTRGTAR